MANSRRASFRWILAVGLVLTAAGSLSAQRRDYGRTAISIPPQTEAGEWGGSWVYTSRNIKVAIWMREKKNRVQVKMQYRNVDSGEGFVTDWNGRAEYRFNESVGEVSIEPIEMDANRLRAKWSWRLRSPARLTSRTETADLAIFRTADGRMLAINFEGLERVHGGTRERRLAYEQIWVLTKVSNRLLDWEELPL